MQPLCHAHVMYILQLQRGLAEGTLKPGLIGEIAPPRTFTNNVV